MSWPIECGRSLRLQVIPQRLMKPSSHNFVHHDDALVALYAETGLVMALVEGGSATTR